MRTVEIVELAFLRANLAAAAAVLLILLLRRPARAAFGCQAAYSLWWLPLAAAAVSLFPPADEFTAAGLLPRLHAGAPYGWTAGQLFGQDRSGSRLAAAALVVWGLGVAAGVLLLTVRELAFRRAARAGLAGPAVAGVLWPRIVTPSDHAARFDPRARAMILAHEQQHLARGDTWANALLAACTTLAWFNPLAHLAARAVRLDQELACDAAVLAPGRFSRRDYAQTLAVAHRAAPVGTLAAFWRAGGEHPLLIRVAMLSAPDRPERIRTLGAGLLLGVGLALAAATWTLLPPGGVLAAAFLR